MCAMGSEVSSYSLSRPAVSVLCDPGKMSRKTFEEECPIRFCPVLTLVPTSTMAVAAIDRRSWKSSPGNPASRHAGCHPVEPVGVAQRLDTGGNENKLISVSCRRPPSCQVRRQLLDEPHRDGELAASSRRLRARHRERAVQEVQRPERERGALRPAQAGGNADPHHGAFGPELRRGAPARRRSAPAGPSRTS